MRRSAVLTGLGILSPIGIGAERFWQSACGGRSGLSRPTVFPPSRIPIESQIVGEIKNFQPKEWFAGNTHKTIGRFSQFAIAATRMALALQRLTMRFCIVF